VSTITSIDDFVGHLAQRGLTPEPDGKGGWLALCPAHNDHTPSLRIARGDQVPIVVTCRSVGCDTADVLAAVDLDWSALYANGIDTSARNSSATPTSQKPLPGPLPSDTDVAEWNTALLAQAGKRGIEGWTAEVISQFEIGSAPPNACGEHSSRLAFPIRGADRRLVNVRLLDPEETTKYKWRPYSKGHGCHLFPHPSRVDDTRVWLVEGERDALTLWSLGIPAVAVPGAMIWRSEWEREMARFAEIIVCFDHDDAGRKNARRRARTLALAAGRPRDVRVVWLADCADGVQGFDLSDFVRERCMAIADMDRDEALAIVRQELQAMADAAPVVRSTGSADGSLGEDVDQVREAAASDEAVPAVRLASLSPAPLGGVSPVSPEWAATTAVVSASRRYLHLPGVGATGAAHVLFTLAVAVSADFVGDPLWGLVVGAPSSGKTEAIRGLDSAADRHLNDITAAGLLGWAGGTRNGRVVGLLADCGPRVFATIRDLSTMLAMSNQGNRDQLFGLLRDAYDGRVVRHLGTSPAPLSWEGRLTLLAAVTPSIDRYAVHADALGPRWLYYRLREADTATRRAAAQAARLNAPMLEEHRARMRDLTRTAVATAVPLAREAVLDARLSTAIEDAALTACLGRAAVPRDGYGKREISDLPTIEEPPRIVGQMTHLGRALLGLGADVDLASRLCRRAALDSMPQTRRRVLVALASGERQSVAEIARRSGMDRKLARFALEELASVGVCDFPGRHEGADDDKRRRDWHLAGENAGLVCGVVAADAEWSG